MLKFDTDISKLLHNHASRLNFRCVQILALYSPQIRKMSLHPTEHWIIKGYISKITLDSETPARKGR